MYKLYKITDAGALTLIAQGSRGKLGPLMNQLSQGGRNPHALYDINGALVARSW